MKSSQNIDNLILLVPVIIYIWLCLCLYKIAVKLDMDSPIIAFIPIINLAFICKMADSSPLFLFLFFVPVISLIWAVIVWMRLSENIDHSQWWALLMIIPPFSLVVPGYLAFARE